MGGKYTESLSSAEEMMFCKSILHEFMVKLNMGIPSYSTVRTEGLLPAFVSSVIVDGVEYTGDKAKCKKEAEQMAARKVIQTILQYACKIDHRNLLSQIIRSKSRLYPLQNQDVISKQNTEAVVMTPSVVSPQTSFPGLTKEQEVEDYSLGTTLKLKGQEMMFCKSILHEFMVKLNMGIPSYSTVKTEGSLPAFVSSVIYDGVEYTGDIAKCKKEAEQMAARNVIQAILGGACNSDHRNLLSQIIRSKSRLYPLQNQDVISKQNTEMVFLTPSLVSPQTSFPGLPREQVEDYPLGTTLKMKKPKTEYFSDQISGSVNNQPGINQIDVLSQTLNFTIVEAAKRVSKVLLEMMHSNGTSMAVPVGNLPQTMSDSSDKNDESKLTVGASVFKSNEALGCSSEKPSTQGNNDSMDVMHLLKNQTEKSGRSKKNKKRSEKSS